MEDISRELEKEIDSYSSPARNKRRTEIRLIAVDDFGKMKSADWLKKVLLSLSVLCLVFLITTVLFFKLYANYKTEFKKLKTELNLAEKKVQESIKDKEYLMAKLVISGGNSEEVKPKAKEIKAETKKIIESKVVKVAKKKQKPATRPVPVKIASKPVPEKIATYSSAQPSVASETPSELEIIKNVGIDRFLITKEEATGDILVNFRVLNVASERGEARGRVFVLLSSSDGADVNKIVVPTVPLKNNIPANSRRGQYFAIAHFKSVKFRIPNIPNPELFDKATVFVFGKGDALILNEEIDISISQ